MRDRAFRISSVAVPSSASATGAMPDAHADLRQAQNNALSLQRLSPEANLVIEVLAVSNAA